MKKIIVTVSFLFILQIGVFAQRQVARYESFGSACEAAHTRPNALLFPCKSGESREAALSRQGKNLAEAQRFHRNLGTNSPYCGGWYVEYDEQVAHHQEQLESAPAPSSNVDWLDVGVRAFEAVATIASAFQGGGYGGYDDGYYPRRGFLEQEHVFLRDRDCDNDRRDPVPATPITVKVKNKVKVANTNLNENDNSNAVVIGSGPSTGGGMTTRPTPTTHNDGPLRPTSPPYVGTNPPNRPSQQPTIQDRVNESQQPGNPLVFRQGDLTADPNGARRVERDRVRQDRGALTNPVLASASNEGRQALRAERQMDDGVMRRVSLEAEQPREPQHLRRQQQDSYPAARPEVRSVRQQAPIQHRMAAPRQQHRSPAMAQQRPQARPQMRRSAPPAQHRKMSSGGGGSHRKQANRGSGGGGRKGGGGKRK